MRWGHYKLEFFRFNDLSVEFAIKEKNIYNIFM